MITKEGIITYEVALLEKPIDEGLVWKDIALLYVLIASTLREVEVLPIMIEAEHHESIAMGFIKSDIYEKLDLDNNDGLAKFIASIMDDMNKENPDHRYTYQGFDIYLGR